VVSARGWRGKTLPMWSKKKEPEMAYYTVRYYTVYIVEGVEVAIPTKIVIPETEIEFVEGLGEVVDITLVL
jgi:hypothetical protein